MNVKEKAKNFWEKHYKTIINVGAVAAIVCGCVILVNGTVRYIVPYKQKVVRKQIIELLTYGENGERHSIFTTISKEGVPVGELGELGLKMVESGCPKDIKAKKFIVIGESFDK